MEHCVVPALFRTAVKSKWDMVWGLNNKMYGWQGVRAGLNWARGEQLGDPKVPVHDLEGHHGPKYKGPSLEVWYSRMCFWLSYHVWKSTAVKRCNLVKAREEI